MCTKNEESKKKMYDVHVANEITFGNTIIYKTELHTVYIACFNAHTNKAVIDEKSYMHNN